MKSAAAITGKVVLFFAVMGLGALVMYFGILTSATSNVAHRCHSDRNGEFTISITKYNVAGEAHCYKP